MRAVRRTTGWDVTYSQDPVKTDTTGGVHRDGKITQNLYCILTFDLPTASIS